MRPRLLTPAVVAVFLALAAALSSIELGGQRRVGRGVPARGRGQTESFRIAAGPTYSGQLFDAHHHFMPPPGSRGNKGGNVSTSQFFERLRKSGVSGVFLFGPQQATTQERGANAEYAYPYADVPIDRRGEQAQLRFDNQTAGYIEQQLKMGMKGIGEIPMRHGPTFQGNYKGYPADGPVALSVYSLAAKYKVPVNIHVEHEYRDEWERALSASRDTTFIWAHVGDGPASLSRDLMKKYPNLHADISTRNPWMKIGKGFDAIALTDLNGRLKDDWKAAFEEFPDRFLFGLDANTPDNIEILDQLMAYYRSVLGQVTAATAEKIAYKNARRLLGEDR